MGSYCPLLREQCKEDGCAFWKEQCLFISFLENVTARSSSEVADQEEEVLIPKEMRDFSADELADEIFSYVKKESQDDETGWRGDLYNEFWNSKGIEDRFDLPKDIQSKMEKAEKIAEKKLEKDSKEREQIKYQKEKEILPQLIEDCIKWAKQNGLKRLTKSDISAFILEKDLELFADTETILYSKVNARLKENG